MSNSVQYGYKGIKVNVIQLTTHPAKIVWDMLKQTWIKLHDKEYNEHDKEIKQFIDESLAKRLNPSPLETLYCQVIFRNISRVCLSQITRQRDWLFNSESQMPQAPIHNVVIPLNIANSEYRDEYLDLIDRSQKLYDKMVKGNENKETTNIPYQDARYCLLNGQTTDLSASFKLVKFVSDCGGRMDNNTHDEINYVFRLTKKAILDYVDNNNDMDSLDKYVYHALLKNADALGAKQHKSFCCDAMFGNSFKRYPDGNEYVTKATENCLLDYKKLAWVDELKRIYKEEPELLEDSEKEMIEKWNI